MNVCASRVIRLLLCLDFLSLVHLVPSAFWGYWNDGSVQPLFLLGG
jgi:hypothetical protein